MSEKIIFPDADVAGPQLGGQFGCQPVHDLESDAWVFVTEPKESVTGNADKLCIGLATHRCCALHIVLD